MRLVLALVLMALGAVTANAAAADDPVALIAAIYKTYTDIGPGKSGMPGLAHVYSKRLQALIDKDATETPEGMVGRIDWDVFVDGQDWQLTGLDIKEVSRADAAADGARDLQEFRRAARYAVRSRARERTLAHRRDPRDAEAALGDVEDPERRAGRLSRRHAGQRRRRRLTFWSYLPLAGRSDDAFRSSSEAVARREGGVGVGGADRRRRRSPHPAIRPWPARHPPHQGEG